MLACSEYLYFVIHILYILVAQFSEKEMELRTLDEHRAQCSLLEDNNSGSDVSKEYGINFESCLLQLR